MQFGIPFNGIFRLTISMKPNDMFGLCFSLLKTYMHLCPNAESITMVYYANLLRHCKAPWPCTWHQQQKFRSAFRVLIIGIYYTYWFAFDNTRNILYCHECCSSSGQFEIKSSLEELIVVAALWTWGSAQHGYALAWAPRVWQDNLLHCILSHTSIHHLTSPQIPSNITSERVPDEPR